MKRAAFLLAAAALAACSSAPKKAAPTPAAAPPPVEVSTETASAPEPDVRGVEFEASDAVQAVHFDFDRYNLTDDSRRILKANADYLRSVSGWTVEVEGHCDERGTVAYNEALGQKRAKEVRDYYIHLGLSARRIATISYGKERPGCRESTEDCWARNRRAETRVNLPGAARKDAPSAPQ